MFCICIYIFFIIFQNIILKTSEILFFFYFLTLCCILYKWNREFVNFLAKSGRTWFKLIFCRPSQDRVVLFSPDTRWTGPVLHFFSFRARPELQYLQTCSEYNGRKLVQAHVKKAIFFVTLIVILHICLTKYLEM